MHSLLATPAVLYAWQALEHMRHMIEEHNYEIDRHRAAYRRAKAAMEEAAAALAAAEQRKAQLSEELTMLVQQSAGAQLKVCVDVFCIWGGGGYKGGSCSTCGKQGRLQHVVGLLLLTLPTVCRATAAAETGTTVRRAGSPDGRPAVRARRIRGGHQWWSNGSRQ